MQMLNLENSYMQAQRNIYNTFSHYVYDQNRETYTQHLEKPNPNK